MKVIFLSAVSKSIAEELFPIIPYSRFLFLTNIIRKHLKSSLSRHYNFQLSDLNSYPSKKKRQYFHKKMQRELKKTRPKKQVCILFTKIKREVYIIMTNVHNLSIKKVMTCIFYGQYEVEKDKRAYQNNKKFEHSNHSNYGKNAAPYN